MKYHVAFDIDFRRNTSQGLYIAFEGIDGSGKTTQVEQLIDYFTKQGREVVKTREPRKDVGIIGKLIQEILYGKTKISPVAFQYLFSADRQMHHQELILPALKAGKVVISDRCFWSAIPYGLLDNEEAVENNSIMQKLAAQSILSFYHEFTVPDKTIFLEISLETAMERVHKVKDKQHEIYEDKQKLKRVLEGYEWLLKEFSKQFTTVNAEQPVEKVTQNVISCINT